jgi:MoaA/NifB/PqqE/SkfB family radical SAM enzyme
MFELLPQVPRYWMFRRFGWPKVLPVNVAVSIISTCNSRCRTCNIWAETTPGDGEDLTVEEFDRIFRSLGRAPYWFTVSGGEPFMRKDIVEICRSIYDRCRPAQINIPTNSLVWRPIAERVAAIADHCKESELVINLSLDGVGPVHDEVRGIKGNFEKVMLVYDQLRGLKRPNLTVGVHSVISNFNIDHFPTLHDFVVNELKPDSFISEIAEERVELGTIGTGITPGRGAYADAVDRLIESSAENAHQGRSQVIQAFRRKYYDLVKRYLETQGQAVPCHAGWASAHIAPNGDVWTCAVRAEPIANLRDHGYDFKRIWFGSEASPLRKSIRRGECACPLANAAYTSMLMSPTTMLEVGTNLWQERRKDDTRGGISRPAAAIRRH